MGVIHRRTQDGPFMEWEGVNTHTYSGDSVASGATKQILINHEDGAPNFALRYFTIPAGGSSNLDHHEHDHGVMIMHGEGRVLLGEEYHDIEAGDVVYVSGWEKHQFESTTDQPLTFLCIIPPRGVPNAAQPAVETSNGASFNFDEC